MSTEYKLGFLAGFIMVAVFFAVLAKISRKSCSGKEFDERQELERGKAYKCGFMTFLIVEAILIFGRGLDIDYSAYMDELSLYFLVMFIPLAVFAGVAVSRDAFFALNMTNRRSYTLYIIICACNLIPGIMNVASGEIFDENGVIQASGGFINILLGLLFAVLLLAEFIKRRTPQEEED